MTDDESKVKGFFLYNNQLDSLLELSPEQVTKVLIACRKYNSGETPEIDDPVVRCVFGIMRPSIDKSIKRAMSGRKGGEANASKLKQNEANESKGEANESKTKQSEANKNKNKNKNKKQEEKENPPLSPQGGNTRPDNAFKKSFGEFGNVKLTDEEHERLENEYGKEDTFEAIKFLDLYIGGRKGGDPYKSHYMAMKNWVFNAVYEQQRRSGLQRASPVQQVKSWDDRVSDANIAAFLAAEEKRERQMAGGA